jgi:hypothetical protein
MLFIILYCITAYFVFLYMYVEATILTGLWKEMYYRGLHIHTHCRSWTGRRSWVGTIPASYSVRKPVILPSGLQSPHANASNLVTATFFHIASNLLLADNAVKYTINRWHTLNMEHLCATSLSQRGDFKIIIIQFFIIYVPSQQLQGQLQTQYSVDIGNYIMDRHYIKSKTNYKQTLEEENTLIQKSKHTNNHSNFNSSAVQRPMLIL